VIKFTLVKIKAAHAAFIFVDQPEIVRFFTGMTFIPSPKDEGFTHTAATLI
jgi:hypothetical protein